ncbi:MAG: mannose-1-phosphate guanylyltransferase [bacterium]|nr:mannose-1-phosphate guanylyltransferase [bacterium]
MPHTSPPLPQPVALIMAGGAGTRFWPVSKRQRPKQFLSLCSERTLIQECFDRLQGFIPPERIMVLTSVDFLDLVKEQLPEIDPLRIIGEPCRRDTAGAVALGALLAQRIYGDCTLVTLTSDPCIHPTELFQATLRSAVAGAQQADTALYTMGIAPDFPSVSYGYLHRGERLSGFDDIPHYRLQGFREKPDLQTAEQYLASGEYYWNSGMFIWQTKAILAELRRHLPQHLAILEPIMSAYGTERWPSALAQAFAQLPRISIDYAVMEKAKDVRTVEAQFSWYDVGSWQALEPFLNDDGQGNRCRGTCLSWDSRHNIVYSDDPQRKIALVGVEDLVVVQSGQHTLVVSRRHLEDVKKLVANLPADEQ